MVDKTEVHVAERWAGALKAPRLRGQVTRKSLDEGHCFPLILRQPLTPEGGGPSQGSPGPQLQESLAWVLVTFPAQPVSGPMPW